MNSSIERVQREVDLAAAEERRRLDLFTKARKKRANVRSDENVPVARGNATEEAVAATSGQEGLAVVIEDSVGPAPEAAAGATPADIKSVQVTDDAGSQRLTGIAGALQETEDEVAVMVPCLDGQESAAAADTLAVADAAQAGDDDTAEVEELIEKLKAENLTLHGKQIAEKTAHSRALLDNVRL